jgi:hypothetical protein
MDTRGMSDLLVGSSVRIGAGTRRFGRGRSRRAAIILMVAEAGKEKMRRDDKRLKTSGEGNWARDGFRNEPAPRIDPFPDLLT